MTDPAIAAVVEMAAVGCLVGAGPPIQQLSLPHDEWLVHVAVVRRANDIRKAELAGIHRVTWIEVPTPAPEVEEVSRGD